MFATEEFNKKMFMIENSPFDDSSMHLMIPHVWKPLPNATASNEMWLLAKIGMKRKRNVVTKSLLSSTIFPAYFVGKKQKYFVFYQK